MKQDYIEEFRLSIVDLAQQQQLTDAEKAAVSKLATSAQLLVLQATKRSRLSNKRMINQLVKVRNSIIGKILERKARQHNGNLSFK